MAEDGVRLLTPAMDESPEHQAVWEQLSKPGPGGPEVLNEAEFVSAMRLHQLAYVVVPLSKTVDDAALEALTHYVTGGGKLILMPMVPLSQVVENPLLALIDIHPAGLQVFNGDLKLQWKGQESPQAGAQAISLPKNSTLLAIALSKQVELLASWDNEASAVVQTSKGVLFNCQWGTLSKPMADPASATPVAWGDLGREPLPVVVQNLLAMQPFKIEPAAVEVTAQQPATSTPQATETKATPEATVSVPEKKSEVPGPSEKAQTEEGSTPASLAHVTPVNPVMVVKQSEAKPVENAPEAKTEVITPAIVPVRPSPAAQPAIPPASSTNIQPESKPTSVAGNPASGTKVAIVPVEEEKPAHAEKKASEKQEKPAKIKPKQAEAKVDAASAAKPAAASIKVAVVQPTPKPVEYDKPEAQTPATSEAPKTPVKTANGEDEVLNNILGIPTNNGPATPVQPSDEKQQKHFSFLDAGASSILAPEFDYGVYSMNMRALDHYKKHIQDALDTSKQLSFNIPETQVIGLLAESDTHKKKFETLYLAGQTQPGLDEYAQARKLSLQALALTTQSPKVEGRAIWLDRGTIVQAGGPAELKIIMQKLHRAGINIVYFEALNAGFPLYQSAMLKPNPLIQGWDPLQAAAEEGHRLGMEVHAWVWCFAVGNRRHNDLIGKPSAYAGPVLEDNGLMSEALRGRDGGLNMDPRQNEYWLSPASPKGREFLINAYKEILTRYPVDGLHLDYIRYPFQTGGTRMGFEPIGKDRFAQSTGMNLDNLDDYTLRMWIAWKTYQVSSFVQQVSEMVHQTRPEVKISAAVFPMKRESRIVSIQQDWETWVDNGWVDMLNPMSYTTDPDKLQSIYEYVSTSSQKRTLFYPGIALKHLDGSTLVSQLEALREKGGMGSTLFAGAYLDSEKVDTLGLGPYKDTSSLPPHRDAFRALQTLVTEYDQKLAQLQSNGGIAAADASNLRTTAGQLSASLNAVKLDPTQGAQIQQTLQKLQSLNTTWTNQDKAAHPYRAAYFANLMFQINELMGYWVDKSTQPKTASDFAKFNNFNKAVALPSVSTAATTADKPDDVDEASDKAKPAAISKPNTSSNAPVATPKPAIPVTTAN